LTNNDSVFSSPSSKPEVPFYGIPQPRRKDRPSSMLSWLQQAPISFGCIPTFIEQALIAIRDPTRADAVAAVGELTGCHQLQQLLRNMQRDPVGQEILHQRPLVSKATIPIDALLLRAQRIRERHQVQRALSTTSEEQIPISFGDAYGLFLLEHGFDPDERDDVKYLLENGDEAYVMLRYRQCHDYWHTLTELPPTVCGEIGLKLLELFHMHMPVAALSCLASALVKDLTPSEQHRIWNVYLPWARQQAAHMEQAQVSLLHVYYERELDTPLRELRRALHLQPVTEWPHPKP
jgi:ubiquinone biosynthesis protein COQ4